MKIAYFDCFSGAAGDMILGALVSAGLDPEFLRAELAKLPVTNYQLEIKPVRKQGFAATKVDVHIGEDQAHRHLHHVVKIIDGAALSDGVKSQAKKAFTRLAEAEAKVHGTTIEKVHFHEVGAVDAIVDVVGAMIGVEKLGLQRICCSPIPTGSGTVKCQHGIMPVPAPATAELLAGVPIAPTEEMGELTTPTGAAILTTLAESFGPMPAMKIERVGYSAGTRDGVTRPNVLRLIVGNAAEQGGTKDEIVLLEANLDDATGQQIGYLFDILFAAGAVDVFTTPIQMKKNRPGVILSVLAPWEREAACADIILTQTTTFGLRRTVCSRRKLERRIETVGTRFGEIRMKVGLEGGQVVKAAPEYDDCAAAAGKFSVPLADVMREAQQAWASGRRS